MKQAIVLIVDDEPNNFDVIETFLNNQDYQLHYVANGRDAISCIEVLQPDVILLDVMMPDIDGIKVCSIIKEDLRWQAIPIIMVTALSAKEDLARCLEAGADDFISKPVNSFELRARVQSMLRIKKQHDRIQDFSRLQNDTIKALKQSLEELTCNIATSIPHELNTPLFSIIGALDLLKMELEEKGIFGFTEILGWLDQSTHRLQKLTEKLLTYLELELSASRRQPIIFGQTHCSIEKARSALHPHVHSFGRDKDLVLTIEEANIPLSERYLSIILYELVDNALKFSSPHTAIHVNSQVIDEQLNISVSDLGRGMSDEQIHKIAAFNQFERKTYEQQGIGIGLKIVKKMIAQSGGSFSITSVYKQGTTVHITLPIV